MRVARTAVVAAGVVIALVAAIWFAFRASPWPGVWLIRTVFDAGARDALEKQRRHLPDGVDALLDARYEPADADAKVDVHRPATADRPLPALLWIHGGAWVSGRKEDMAHWARIIAARGYVVAAIDYTLAPDAYFPVQLGQAAAALRWLDREAERLRVDRSRLFVGGDSAGAQLAAQLATVVRSPQYAKRLGIASPIAPQRLVGVVLHCGAYDLRQLKLDGALGGLIRTVLWSYSGTRDFADDPRFALASVIDHVTPAFPPAFVSGGNADPLTPQSKALVARLTAMGVPVDALFFADDHAPPLGHEYQFDLDRAAGREAFERMVAFLGAH